MKNISFFGIFFFLLSLLSCKRENVHHYKFENGDIITRIDNRGTLETFIIEDSVTSVVKDINAFYIKDKPLMNGFQALLYKRNDSIILLQPYNYFGVKGNPKRMHLENVADTTFFKLYFDKSLPNSYIKIEND